MARVLVIDDETTVGVVLRWTFGVKGHRTIAAEDGRRGIEMARAEHPDAIVLDMMMPGGLSGYDLLGELRNAADLDAVPVLVLTAITHSTELQRCLSEGADAVMTKPFDPLDVANAIDQLLLVHPRTETPVLPHGHAETPRRLADQAACFPSCSSIVGSIATAGAY